MIKLTDKIINIVNNEKKKKGLENTHAPLLPFFKVNNNELKIIVLLTKDNDNIWDNNEKIKAEYWIVLNPNSLEVEEFNKTTDKDYNSFSSNEKEAISEKEIIKFSIEKKLQYKNYIKKDILSTSLPIQEKLSNLLDNKIKVDGEYVDIDSYIVSNIEYEIDKLMDEVVDKLVDCAVSSKYSTITYYYEELFNRVINEFKEEDQISTDKIDAIINIIKNYYVGAII